MNNIYIHSKNGETTGSIGEKNIDSPKNETTGSIGYYSFGKEGTPAFNRSLSRDDVSFQKNGSYVSNKHSSYSNYGVATLAALTIVGAGQAYRTKAINKVNNEQVKKILTIVTEPCYKLCSFLKKESVNLYKKVFNQAS